MRTAKTWGRIESRQRVIGDLELFALGAALECADGWLLDEARNAILARTADIKPDAS